MQPAIFRLETLFERYEHVKDMLVLGSSDAHTRTIGELLRMSGESLPDDLPLGYTEPRGEARLRDAIAAVHGVDRERVLVTVGASEAIFLLMRSLLTDGDRALVGTPAYQSLVEMARDARASVEEYRYPPEHDFKPDPEALADQIARAAPPFRCVVLNSPHNPTGRVLDSAGLTLILEAARAAGTIVVVDEVMNGIFAPATERVASVTTMSPDAIAIGSVSKAYGLGGLRIGWIVAPREVIDLCTQWRYYTTISPPAILQRLAAIAVEQRGKILPENESIVRANHATLASWIAAHPSMELLPWEGGTVVLVRAANDEELSRRLAEEAKVFVVPCATFDLPGYLRVGLGMRSEDFSRALDRMDGFLNSS
jgi:aspartate/methionine/tyrosine aminotransferase